jgi:peptide/nickel transport system permease protein
MTAVVGGVLVAVVVVAGLAAPLISGLSPFMQGLDALHPPGAGHPLGTDEFGRDLLSRTLYGIRADLVVGLLAVPVAALIGTVLGLLSPIHNAVDATVQRVFDVILSFPALILGVGVAAGIGPGLTAIVITIILHSTPAFGRLARTAVLSERGREYVLAARVLGASPARVLFRHILPNSLDALVVQFALAMASAVLLEGGMSFVGLGIQLPNPSLGGLLNESVLNLAASPTYPVGPIVALVALVIGLNLIADAVNAARARR